MENSIKNEIRIDIQKLKKLPTLSENAEKIIRLTARENIHLDELVRVIEKDPPIMSKVLGIANIVYFGIDKPIVSIKDALLKIGFKILKNIALSVAIFSIFKVSGKRESSYRRLYMHSVMTATICKIISENYLKELIDDSFTAGMLHDIGLFALHYSFYESFKEVEKAVLSGVPLIEAEEKITGTNHLQIGRWLAECWGLPEIICDVISNHGRVPDPFTRNGKIIALVHLATHIAENLGYKLFDSSEGCTFYEKEVYEILSLPKKDELMSEIKTLLSETEVL